MSHEYNCAHAKTVEDCFEIATVDAYDESEQAMGWLTCLEEVFEGVSNVRVMGDTAVFEQFSSQRNDIVAIIKKNGKTAKVSLESINWIKLTPIQKLWNRAYLARLGQ